MTTNDWIADRRPTEADGDSDGDVRARRNPDDSDYSYLHWSYVGEATPWKHCAYWQPPTTPTKPALAVGQRWRRRDGEVVTVRLNSDGSFKADGWGYMPDGTAPFPNSPDLRLELIELLPTPAPRKFKETPKRTVTDFGHTIDAIDDDGVAWWMVIGPDDCSDTEWHQLLPLPAKEAAQ